MEKNLLTALPRSEKGSGAARRLRRAGKIPAVIYGEGTSEPILLDAKDFRHATHGTSGSTIFTLTVDGKKSTAIIKEIQRDPTRDEVTHVDFQKIAMTERIHATVPLNMTGDSPGVKMGGVLQHATWEIDVSALAKDMPEGIEVDLSGLEIGDSIHVSDLSLPAGVEVLTSSETMVATVLPPTIIHEEVVEVPVEEAEAAEAAAAEAEKAGEAEGEG